MIGTFRYHKNCSIIHHIPPGEVKDGYPVIVFPKREADVVEGQTYDFTLQMTRDATYTVDNEVYRVGHAVGLINVGEQGDFVDALVHGRTVGDGSAKVADALGDDTVSALEALKARLTS